MSQEKVNKYKEQKANRKELLAKEKRNKKLGKAAWILVFVLIIAGIGTAIGIEIHGWYKNTYLPGQPNYSSEELIISDVAGILDEETEAAPEESADEETGADTESADESAAEDASEEAADNEAE